MIPPVYDIVGNLISQAGFTNDGLWAYLYLAKAPATPSGPVTDYDLCWIYLGPRPPGVPLTLFVAASRNGKAVSQWVPLAVKPASTVNLSCAASNVKLLDKYVQTKVCGTSSIKVLTGLDGSPSPYLTSFYFEDKNNLLLEVDGKKNPNAPGFARRLSNVIKDALGIVPLAK